MPRKKANSKKRIQKKASPKKASPKKASPKKASSKKASSKKASPKNATPTKGVPSKGNINKGSFKKAIPIYQGLLSMILMNITVLTLYLMFLIILHHFTMIWKFQNMICLEQRILMEQIRLMGYIKSCRVYRMPVVKNLYE